jgi:hypothetical protein
MSWAFHPLTASAATLLSNAIPGQIRYWDGTQWIDGILTKYNGDDFKNVQDIQLWDGQQWVIVLLNN